MTFDELMDLYGTQTKAGDALGVAQTTVADWKKFGIPLPRQYQIQVLTGGVLKADPTPKRRKAA